MRVTQIIQSILMICCLFLTVACQQAETPNVSLHLNLFTDPLSLDPGIPKDITSTTVIGMLFEGLTRLDGNNEPSLAATKAVEISPDGKTYTFHLRPSLWTNGKVVSAEHFAFAWKRILNPRFPASHAYHLFVIRGARAAKKGEIPLDEVGIEVVDSTTLRVHLEHPAPYFLHLVASTLFYPVYPGKATVTNGPFRLVKWDHYKELVVEKNPMYWDAPNVHLDRIVMVMIENQNTELSMFEQGELDWVGAPLSALPFDALSTARKNPGFHTIPIAATYWYQFNSNVIPFQNAKMRRAFAYAVNRTEIGDHITRGTHTPADALIPPMLKASHTNYFNDTVHAKVLFEEGLAELGLTRENLPPIKLSYNRGDDHHKIAQAIQEQWEKTFGIPVELSETEWDIHLSRLRQGNFMVARSYWCAAYADPVDFFNRFRFPTAVGFGAYTGDHWDQSTYASYLDAADQTSDPLEREELLAKAEEVFLQEMPVAPLFFLTSNYLQSPRLKNVVVSPLDRLDFRWAYLN